MKLRKHIYIEETLLEQIEVDNKANFSLYISNLINEDLINMRKSKNELDQNEKNIKYLLNHLNTQNQVLMNLLIYFMKNDNNQTLMIPYHSSEIYQQAKSLVDNEKRRNRDKMRGK